MRLTQFSDYALRALMYAADRPQRRFTITELAEHHSISRSHLTKVVVYLAGKGYLQSTRGRGGGLCLARPAESIRVGEVLRDTEEDFRLVECFEHASSACVLTAHCRLARELQAALDGFFAHLDALTLADLRGAKWTSPLGQTSAQIRIDPFGQAGSEPIGRAAAWRSVTLKFFPLLLLAEAKPRL